MAYNCPQLRMLLTKWLEEWGLYSPAAVELLLGTMAQESRFGTDLFQIGGGPALGAFQIEPATYNDIQDRFHRQYPMLLAVSWHEACTWNLKLSALVARLKYYSIPGPLPAAGDIEGMARYYKKWYNTPAGKGTEQEFVDNYHRYVLL